MATCPQLAGGELVCNDEFIGGPNRPVMHKLYPELMLPRAA